jgi:hypothetical protein
MNQVFTQPVGRDPNTRAAVSPYLAYAAAVTVGGGLTGALLSSAGLAVRRAVPHAAIWLWLPALGLIAAAIALERKGRVRPLPQRHAQVPRAWTLWPSRVRLGLAFGFLLGAGVFTYLHHATAYVLGALIVLSPNLTAGVVIGCAYGATRAFLLGVAWARPARLDSGGDLSPAMSLKAADLLPAIASGATAVAILLTIS